MNARAVLVAGSAAFYLGATILLIVDHRLCPAARDHPDATRDRLDAAIVCGVLASVFAVAATRL